MRFSTSSLPTPPGSDSKYPPRPHHGGPKPLWTPPEGGALRPGGLSICGTPLGNLEDMTYRAVRTLREADIVAAEDTRVSRPLLTHFDISSPTLVSYREDNQEVVGAQLVMAMQAGARVALITDAGMPGVSDPGMALVQACRVEGLTVDVVPGPSAVLMALLASGFLAQRFVFEGFLPRSSSHRRDRLQALAHEDRPVVVFEAPHRLLKTLEELRAALGDRQVCVAREMTKKFEEIRVETLSQALDYFQQQSPRGEFTLVLEAGQAPAPTVGDEDLNGFLSTCLAQGMSSRDAADAAAARFGVARKVAYRRCLQQAEKASPQ